MLSEKSDCKHLDIFFENGKRNLFGMAISTKLLNDSKKKKIFLMSSVFDVKDGTEPYFDLGGLKSKQILLPNAQRIIIIFE